MSDDSLAGGTPVDSAELVDVYHDGIDQWARVPRDAVGIVAIKGWKEADPRAQDAPTGIEPDHTEPDNQRLVDVAHDETGATASVPAAALDVVAEQGWSQTADGQVAAAPVPQVGPSTSPADDMSADPAASRKEKP